MPTITSPMIFRMPRAAVVRVLPFVAFLLLLMVRGVIPGDGGWGIDGRWIYGVSVVVVGGLLLWWRNEYGELARQAWPIAHEWLWALGIGMLVFVLWIHLDAPWMVLGEPTARFTPVNAEGGIEWPLVIVRWIGAALLVPVMEELFWRSFLMRWIQHPGFLAVDPASVGPRALWVSTFVFVLAHPMWLAATIAGLAYALLYIRTGKLWVSVVAHAATNGALGVWVVLTRQWQFW